MEELVALLPKVDETMKKLQTKYKTLKDDKKKYKKSSNQMNENEDPYSLEAEEQALVKDHEYLTTLK
jgi:SMC interacting uncharacterized protein involved in chromosome segregation